MYQISSYTSRGRSRGERFKFHALLAVPINQLYVIEELLPSSLHPSAQEDRRQNKGRHLPGLSQLKSRSGIFHRSSCTRIADRNTLRSQSLREVVFSVLLDPGSEHLNYWHSSAPDDGIHCKWS